MTGGYSGDVDIDRLADYVGGALDGTPEAAAVADLIRDDQRWAAEYARLLAADVAVRADLAVLAARPERMPDEVADRLADSLRRLAGDLDADLRRPVPGTEGAPGRSGPRTAAAGTLLAGGRTGAEPAGSRPGGSSGGHRPAGRSGPAGRRGRSSGPDGRRTLRRPRWGTAVAGLVLVTAFGIGGVVGLRAVLDRQQAGTSTMAGPHAGADRSLSRAEAPFRVLSSGSDYNPATLSLLAPGKAGAYSDQGSGAIAAPAPAVRVAPELNRLLDPDLRSACLSAVTSEYGGTVRLVDYARFTGTPALVVALTGVQRQPTDWVVVVGPRCGAGGMDELYHGPLR